MKEINTKIRIKDIATLAGVSEGTVDRVLHQRGDVSEKSRAAVTKVLEEMNYTPNLFARSLASKKQYRFVCLFPQYEQGEYWEIVDKGFSLAAKDFIHHNVHIDKRCFNQFDANSFITVSNEILNNEPDAVLISPIFREETIKFTSELAARGIPFSFIDSTIDDVDFLTYYGQNSFKSGYIAAKLLLESMSEKAQILVIRTQRKGSVSNQTLSRNNGFMQYIQEFNLGNQYELINVEFKNDDEESNRRILSEVFNSNSNIKGAITFNSKVYRLAMHLDALNHTDVRLIGYDLLDQNVSYLQQGVISYLIAQRPDKQAYFTVRDMCKELIFKQEIKKINYVPIDILIKENIEDYMHFTE
ncbi:MAG TPA: LacI family DNA-binding transcriptional regulator [Paludibacter sp.]